MLFAPLSFVRLHKLLMSVGLLLVLPSFAVAQDAAKLLGQSGNAMGFDGGATPTVSPRGMTGLPGVGALSRGNGPQEASTSALEAGAQLVGKGTGPSSTGDLIEALSQKAELPNQFQRFVEQNTGLRLPIHGASLFEGRRFTSLANVPVPSAYVVGPGDDIDLKVWGSIDLALRLTVDRNGQITIPKIGPVTVAGTRADGLDRVLAKQVSRVFRNFELTATLGGLRSIQVYVVGQAKRPGLYTVSGLSTLLSLVFESGGPASTGSMRNIDLMRQSQKITSLDLYDFMQNGSTTKDAALQPGDVVVFRSAGPRVALLGALDTPAIYELKAENESLQALLTYSGGLRVLTSPHKAQIERIDNSTGTASRSVDSRPLDRTGLQTAVRDGDMVTLFPVSPEFANAVTLRGNVAEPLRYPYKKGLRISDLIPEPSALIQPDYYLRKNMIVQYEDTQSAEQTDGSGALRRDKLAEGFKDLLDEINWDYAQVARTNANDVRTELISFNLAKAVREKDPAHNIELQPGDIVTVFNVKDLPVPMAKRSHFVRVAGEVGVPGIYEIQAGETLSSLITRAGGLTPSAYAFGTNFSRESTRAAQQQNLDQALTQIEAQLQAAGQSLVQNASPNASDAATMQAQLAAQRQTLERMRSIKANGRIALEMNPESPIYPDLLLEDGDSITVPLMPSFVGVFGAVLAKTSFIHRPGDTVADYINRAGPTRDADLDAALLIRADGTVLANEAQRSFAGFGSRSFMSTTLMPGDSVFVPDVMDKRNAYTRFLEGAKDWTALLYQFGMGAAGFKALGY